MRSSSAEWIRPGIRWCFFIKSSSAVATWNIFRNHIFSPLKHCKWFTGQFTLICSCSGVRFGSYGIGGPRCVVNLTGNPPKMGAQGNFVKEYSFSQKLWNRFTVRNDSRLFSVNIGIMGYNWQFLNLNTISFITPPHPQISFIALLC